MKKLLFIISFFAINAFTTNLDTNNSLIEFYGKSKTKINIVIKDNIDIQGKVTSAGSLALENNVASENAFIVQKLIDADFHIAGKANLSEWANFRSEDSISGWSSYGGQTKHFLNTEYNPCGSSSGSAVAVAIGIVDIAIGTETNGSISCPSSVNGIVGFKPTVGLVSRSGIVPISNTQDTAGPMGKSVALVAKTLEVIAGYDPLDPATKHIPDDQDFNFSRDLDFLSISGKRFAILQSNSSNTLIKPKLDEIKKILTENGGILVEIEDMREYPGEDEYFLLKYEFKYGLEKYLKNASEKKKTLQEIIDFNEKNRKRVMPYFGQDILISSLEASKDEERYKIAIKRTKAIKDQTLDLFKKHDLDVMIGLTRGPAWKINYDGGDAVAIDRSKSFGNGGFAAISGMPHLTIPFFEIDNFPVGLSIIGPPWSDKKVLEIGAFLESRKKINLPLLSSDENVIIDVRSLGEVKTGIIEDAVHIEWTKIASEIDNLNVSKDDEILLYCRSGNRSGKAQIILQNLGFTNVFNVGGINDAAKKLEKKIVKYSD
tara:strand:- start:293 stop:1927 length:1635 start_codon:yes stop_codon:yes gene_type:complete